MIMLEATPGGVAMSKCLGLPLQVDYSCHLDGPPGSAAQQLRLVIQSCLQSRPEERPTAPQVQAQLYAIITQQRWSTDMNDAM